MNIGKAMLITIRVTKNKEIPKNPSVEIVEMKYTCVLDTECLKQKNIYLRLEAFESL